MLWLWIVLGIIGWLSILLFVLGAFGAVRGMLDAGDELAQKHYDALDYKIDKLVETLAAPPDVTGILASMSQGELTDLAAKVQERKRGR